MLYGRAVGRSTYSPLLSLIESPELSAGGNLILRVGRENGEGRGWSKTEHIVLTPEEARSFIDELCRIRTAAERG